VREDPDREGLLYAGTEFGLFISFDNGGNWQPFHLNIGNLPINDIQVKNKDLVIATQGRAMWILDNVSILHQVTPQMSLSEDHLFAPRDGYRTSTAVQLLGPNIDYYLPTPLSGTVSLDILDYAGRMVNSYSSARPARSGGSGGRGGGGGFGGRGGGAPAPSVTTNAGFNRMVWNVRDTEGLSVPPGQYRARLSVGGESQTQTFNVLIDPRVEAGGVTVADLREQYEHNKRMNAMVAEVDALIERVRAAQDSDDNNLQRRIAPIAEKLITAPIRYSSPGLRDHITYLQGMTARVDMKIGRDAIARHEVLRAELDEITREANDILGSGN